VLGGFLNSANEACLHTDARVLPRRAAARASWNYRLNRAGQPTLTYDMNRLQALEVPENYCVTLNSTAEIDARQRIQVIPYRHPLYTAAAIQSQTRWQEISGVRHTHFCGAYWFYGFHEDGVRSALRVAEALGVRP
jgi:predicted NAD/FAD-binding protein